MASVCNVFSLYKTNLLTKMLLQMIKTVFYVILSIFFQWNTCDYCIIVGCTSILKCLVCSCSMMRWSSHGGPTEVSEPWRISERDSEFEIMYFKPRRLKRREAVFILLFEQTDSWNSYNTHYILNNPRMC